MSRIVEPRKLWLPFSAVVLAVLVLASAGNPVRAGDPKAPDASEPEHSDPSDAPAAASEEETEAADSRPVPEYAPPFTLKDQYKDEHRYVFPRERMHLLLISDYGGLDQVEDWYEDVILDYKGEIGMHGLADARIVPFIFRPLLRMHVRRETDETVLIDWKGRVVDRYGCVPDNTNIYLIAPDGEVVLHVAGPATEQRKGRVEQVLDGWLARN